MKTIKIEVPEGYEIDRVNSTIDNIVIKKIGKIETVEDACNELGETDEQVKILRLLEQNNIPEKEIAVQQWKVIVKALNKGWVPDFNNTDQRKYYPWFNLQGGVSLYSVSYVSQSSFVPPYFLFKDEETVRYAISQFSSVYKVAWS